MAICNLHLGLDWQTVLKMSDLIKQTNNCPSKQALMPVVPDKNNLSTDFTASTPQLIAPQFIAPQTTEALVALENIVKNSSSAVPDFMTSKAICEVIRNVVKTLDNNSFRSKTFEVVQATKSGLNAFASISKSPDTNQLDASAGLSIVEKRN